MLCGQAPGGLLPRCGAALLHQGEFFGEEMPALDEFVDFGLQFGPIFGGGFAVLPFRVLRSAEFPVDLVRKELHTDSTPAAGPGSVGPSDWSSHDEKRLKGPNGGAEGPAPPEKPELCHRLEIGL